MTTTLIILSSLLIAFIVLVALTTIMEMLEWLISVHAHYTSKEYANRFGNPKAFDKFGFFVLAIAIALYHLIQSYI